MGVMLIEQEGVAKLRDVMLLAMAVPPLVVCQHGRLGPAKQSALWISKILEASVSPPLYRGCLPLLRTKTGISWPERAPRLRFTPDLKGAGPPIHAGTGTG